MDLFGSNAGFDRIEQRLFEVVDRFLNLDCRSFLECSVVVDAVDQQATMIWTFLGGTLPSFQKLNDATMGRFGIGKTP